MKKVEGEKDVLKRELKDERKRVVGVIQESGKEIVKMTKDMAKLQVEKDSLVMVNAKL